MVVITGRANRRPDFPEKDVIAVNLAGLSAGNRGLRCARIDGNRHGTKHRGRDDSGK